jgi:hypothetical protein
MSEYISFPGLDKETVDTTRKIIEWLVENGKWEAKAHISYREFIEQKELLAYLSKDTERWKSVKQPNLGRGGDTWYFKRDTKVDSKPDNAFYIKIASDGITIGIPLTDEEKVEVTNKTLFDIMDSPVAPYTAHVLRMILKRHRDDIYLTDDEIEAFIAEKSLRF